MVRSTFSGRLAVAATAVLALAACSDVNVAPESLAPASPSFSKSDAGDEVVAGEVIVKFRDGVDVDAKALKHGAKKGRKGYGNAFDVFHTNNGNERALAAQLSNDADVEYAEPNYIRHVDADSRLWAFYNPGGLNMQYTSGGTGYISSSYASIADADEDALAGIGSGGAAVTIGSIDTGVEMAHPELVGRTIAGQDWYDNDANPNDTPDEGHGTHTTGTMAGTNVGVAGVTGASANVKVYVQRVCGVNGCPTTAIINAINAAANYIDANGNHLVAVNMSLGGGTESTGEKNAIQNATNQGVLVIASAGNSGTSRVACPACDVNAISVASTTWKDELASYSQYGKGLDISAPGGNCYSNTTPEGCIFSSVSNGYTGGAVSGPTSGSYGWMQGTSMAAPQVTGAAAVVASKLNLRGAALRSRLESTTDDKGAAGYDTRFGNGRLNVYRAVTGASAAAGQ